MTNAHTIAVTDWIFFIIIIMRKYFPISLLYDTQWLGMKNEAIFAHFLHKQLYHDVRIFIQ